MEEEKSEVSKEIEKPKEEKERYEITEIATAVGEAVKDNKTGKIYSKDDLLLEVLNKLDKVERATA